MLKNLVLFTLLIFNCLMAQAMQQELRLKSFTKLSGERQIRLSDIVDDRGLSVQLVEKLKSIVIADAPKLGEQRVFTAQWLSEVMRKHVGAREYSLRIPKQVAVINRGYEISDDAIKAELLSKWQDACKECRIHITGLKLPIMPLALKDRPWKIEAKSNTPKGSFSEPLIVEALDGAKQTFWINGQVTVERKVPVANRTLNANFRLTPEDFRQDWRDVTYATDGTLGESEMIGQQVRLVIPAGQIIWAGSMTREKAVRRGDLVRVVTGSDEWQVVLQAITESDAYIGDRVNVRNVQTKKIITGEVVARGEVIIR